MHTSAVPGAPAADRALLPTGRGVRIAIVDSGVHHGHPHVGRIAGGIGIDETGAITGHFVDRLGHGTAVAGAIREKAPEAELYAVRIFETALVANVRALVAALQWAIQAQVHIVNLSLGTSAPQHEDALRSVVTAAVDAGVLIVAARDDGRTRWLPGSLPGVLAVRADATVPRQTVRVDHEPDGLVFRASPYPRPVPGVPPERNLNGVSFAVANVSGVLARVIASLRGRLTIAEAALALADACR